VCIRCCYEMKGGMQLPSDDNFLGVDLVMRGIHVVVVFDVDGDLDDSLQQDAMRRLGRREEGRGT
jgi:hypothetical protein